MKRLFNKLVWLDPNNKLGFKGWLGNQFIRYAVKRKQPLGGFCG